MNNSSLNRRLTLIAALGFTWLLAGCVSDSGQEYDESLATRDNAYRFGSSRDRYNSLDPYQRAEADRETAIHESSRKNR